MLKKTERLLFPWNQNEVFYIKYRNVANIIKTKFKYLINKYHVKDMKQINLAEPG